MDTCHYRTLGVPEHASAAAIEAGYALALDELRTRLAQGAAPPAEHLDRLRAAYRLLRDPIARAAYDATRKSASSGAAAAPAAGVRPAASASSYAFRFSGDGGEYFRIWIVNLLLTVLTLGIYSAWAKVRREQYFHRNLLLDGAGFDYHGEPKAILKGRAIAFGMLIVLSVAEAIGPTAHGLALLALLPAVPWLAMRALRFRAHNTSYRGLRFAFHGDYRGALTTFVGYGLLVFFSLGLLFPLFYQRLQKYLLDNLSYGTARFRCDAPVGAFFRIFLAPVLAILGFFVVVGMVAAIGGKGVAAVMVGIGAIAYVAFLVTVVPYVRARIANLVWNHTHIDGADLSSTLGAWAYVKLVTVNLVLTVLTLGLFWPWAKVRVARYRADCLALENAAALDEFLAGESTRASAIGDEMSEMFDVDIAL